MTDKRYRPCVGICLINEDGLIFAGERLDNMEAWQMPQGGIDEGENLEDAARRELKEEIGTDKIEITGFYPQPLLYDIPQETLDRLPWGKDYQGQAQNWIYARFVGEDSDIDIKADDKPEFGRWQWMKAEDLLTKIVPFKVDVYKKVLARFL